MTYLSCNNLDDKDCEIGMSILDQRDRVSGKKKASDAAYTLAMHLLAYELNQVAGAYDCGYAEQAAMKAHQLLTAIKYNATGDYLKSSKNSNYSLALKYAKILDNYNNTIDPTTCTSAQLRIASDDDVIEESAEEARVTAYPNPFTDHLMIEFVAEEDTRALVEIYSVTGVKMSTLYEGEITAKKVYRFEYQDTQNTSAVYLYKISTPQGVQVRRVIKSAY